MLKLVENNSVIKYFFFQKSEVANLRKCACVTIAGYDQLDVISTSLSSLRIKIQGLNLDSSNFAILNSNLEKIKGSISELKVYVESYAGNLDEKYIQEYCNQIRSWYSKINSDISTFSSGGGSTVCVTCPRGWTQDSKNCKCSCSVNNCAVATQAIDYWGCKCVPKNSCTKTQATCAAEGKILDYVNCECKSI
jgi:hypothetical protein